MARKEKVTKVIDRDTFEMASRKKPVRLANVSAPEKRHPGAAQAKQALQKLIQETEVTIETVARDSYGRSVARVKVDGKSVNKAMQNILKEQSRGR